MVVKLTPKPIDKELYSLEGISAKQIKQHYEFLYKSYINTANLIREKLATVDITNQNSRYSEYRSLKVAETYNLDGAILHELYFENLSTRKSSPLKILYNAIEKDFGSFKDWERDFLATAGASKGWGALCFDMRDLRLHNYLFDAHNEGIISSAAILLIIDVYEHAYYIDYGVNRANYVKAFMKNIDWNIVNLRFSKIGDYLKSLNLNKK